MYPPATWQYANLRADQHAEAGFFQYADVVIVGVSHSPTGSVSSRLLAIGTVDFSHVSVRPLRPRVVLGDLRIYNIIVTFFIFFSLSLSLIREFHKRAQKNFVEKFLKMYIGRVGQDGPPGQKGMMGENNYPNSSLIGLWGKMDSKSWSINGTTLGILKL